VWRTSRTQIVKPELIFDLGSLDGCFVSLLDTANRFVAILCVLVITPGYLAYAKRYQLAAKLWPGRPGYRVTMQLRNARARTLVHFIMR
jgi:hypothetical protein